METHQKLYIVVRADLSQGLKLAQACHALRAFGARHPEIDREWFERSNNIAVLVVPDEQKLRELLELTESRGLAVAPFLEPDLGDQMTALALEPSAKRFLRRLPLAS